MMAFNHRNYHFIGVSEGRWQSQLFAACILIHYYCRYYFLKRT